MGVLGVDDHFSASFISVTEVDGAILCAVPEAAWHQQKRHRPLPADCLRKPVKVWVPGCFGEDRNSPESQPSFKVWLGVLKGDYEQHVDFSQEGELAQVTFPADTAGVMKVPYAKALLAVARDHFDFFTAESELPLVETPVVEEDAAGMALRLTTLEASLQSIQESLAQLVPKAPAKSTPAGARPKAPPGLPAGVDPVVARQALQAGVSRAALEEMANMFPAGGTSVPPGLTRAAPHKDAVESEEEEEADEGDGGPQNSIEKAVVQMSRILTSMHQDKKVKKDRLLENILDRAESGSADSREVGGSGRSKSAALRRLRALLHQQPELLYKSIEARMQADWDQMGSLPGGSVGTVSARGWLEHRSKIQNYPTSVRAAWSLAGVCDALRCERYAEARARCALAVCQWDQQSCDRGSWLVANELSLEESPPYSAFAAHRALEQWESPHTRLIDDRWLELCMAKLKEIADFQDKRAKLSAPVKDPPKDLVDPKPKKAAKGGKEGKGGKDPPPAVSQ